MSDSNLDKEKNERYDKAIKQPFIFQVPECCRLGLPNCPHVLQKQKPVKKNIGL